MGLVVLGGYCFGFLFGGVFLVKIFPVLSMMKNPFFLLLVLSWALLVQFSDVGLFSGR